MHTWSLDNFLSFPAFPSSSHPLKKSRWPSSVPKMPYFGFSPIDPLPRSAHLLSRLPLYICRTSSGVSCMSSSPPHTQLMSFLPGSDVQFLLLCDWRWKLPVKNHWMCLSLAYRYLLDCTHTTYFTGFLSRVIHHSENTYHLQSLDRLYRTISIWRKNRSSIRFDWHVPMIPLVGRNFQWRSLPVDDFALSSFHTESRSNSRLSDDALAF